MTRTLEKSTTTNNQDVDAPDAHNDTDKTSLSFNDKGQLTDLECGKTAFTKADAEWCGFNGKPGTAVIYTSDGKPDRSESSLKGKLNGISKRYDYNTGKVVSTVMYKDGKAVEAATTNAQGEGLFKSNCDSEFKKYEETKYYEGLKVIESHVKWENHKKIFEQSNYQNGKQKLLSVYKDGKFLVTEFYDTGKKSSVTEYADAPDLSWKDKIQQGVEERYD